MVDKEKVINALEYCVAGDSCVGCVYFKEAVEGDGRCRSLNDAIALLKEQDGRIAELEAVIKRQVNTDDHSF